MLQELQQTRDEKVAMYLESTKRELAEMLATRDEIKEPWEIVKNLQTGPTIWGTAFTSTNVLQFAVDMRRHPSQIWESRNFSS